MFSAVYYLLVTVFSVLLVLIAMPVIIDVAHAWELFDDHAVSRKEHSFGIPRLGGIAFCLSIVLTSMLFTKNATGLPLNDVYAASIILFMLGVKDDLSGASCRTKLFVQALVSLIITVPGNIRITNLHGVFNLHALQYAPSVIISVLIIMFIINSFNLIDGIDGLAGTLGVIVCGAFGVCFMLYEQTELAVLAMSGAGALIVFLSYNYSPARIFMGDAGSMFLGMLSAIFAVKFISVNEVSASLSAKSAPAFAAAVLIIPAFDTISVVLSRLINRQSPFKPDRNHIHHRMLRLGFTHLQTTFILCFTNVLFIVAAIVFNQADTSFMLLFFAVALLLLNGLINQLLRVKAKQPFALAA